MKSSGHCSHMDLAYHGNFACVQRILVLYSHRYVSPFTICVTRFTTPQPRRFLAASDYLPDSVRIRFFLLEYPNTRRICSGMKKYVGARRFASPPVRHRAPGSSAPPTASIRSSLSIKGLYSVPLHYVRGELSRLLARVLSCSSSKAVDGVRLISLLLSAVS